MYAAVRCRGICLVRPLSPRGTQDGGHFVEEMIGFGHAAVDCTRRYSLRQARLSTLTAWRSALGGVGDWTGKGLNSVSVNFRERAAGSKCDRSEKHFRDCCNCQRRMALWQDSQATEIADRTQRVWNQSWWGSPQQKAEARLATLDCPAPRFAHRLSGLAVQTAGQACPGGSASCSDESGLLTPCRGPAGPVGVRPARWRGSPGCRGSEHQECPPPDYSHRARKMVAMPWPAPRCMVASPKRGAAILHGV